MQLPTGSGSSCILFVIQINARTPAAGRETVIQSICITFFGSCRPVLKQFCLTKEQQHVPQGNQSQTDNHALNHVGTENINLTVTLNIGASFHHKNLRSCQEEKKPNSEQNDRSTNNHEQVNDAIIKAFQKPLFSVGKSSKRTYQPKEIQGKHLHKIANATKAEKKAEQTFWDTCTKEGAGSHIDERSCIVIYH